MVIFVFVFGKQIKLKIKVSVNLTTVLKRITQDDTFAGLFTWYVNVICVLQYLSKFLDKIDKILTGSTND